MTRMLAVAAIALAPALAWGAVIPANEILNTPHGNEDSLWEIVNNVYGTSFGSNADMQFAQVGTEIYSGNVAVNATALFAGNTQTFGWYESVLPGNISSTTALFTATGSGYAVTGSGQINASGDFGLFLQSGNHTWYSEVDRNVDKRDHQALYDLAALTGNAAYAGSYLSAWEDLKMGKFGNSDYDYNDLVLQLDMNVVPEPTTMTLLGLGLAGFAARRFRNKKA